MSAVCPGVFSDAGDGDQFGVSSRGNQEVFVGNHVDDSRVIDLVRHAREGAVQRPESGLRWK